MAFLLITAAFIASCKKDASVTNTNNSDSATTVTTDTTKATYYVKFKADTGAYNFVVAVEGNFNKKDAAAITILVSPDKQTRLNPAPTGWSSTGSIPIRWL